MYLQFGGKIRSVPREAPATDKLVVRQPTPLERDRIIYSAQLTDMWLEGEAEHLRYTDLEYELLRNRHTSIVRVRLWDGGINLNNNPSLLPADIGHLLALYGKKINQVYRMISEDKFLLGNFPLEWHLQAES